MKDKIKIIISIILIVICLGLIVFLGEKENTIKSEKDLTKEIDNIIKKTFLNPKVTMKDLQEVTGNHVGKIVIALGNDSYVREKPSKKVIKEYKLKDYEKRQQEYASAFENAFLSNIQYKLLGSNIMNNKMYQEVSIKSYYTGMYFEDLTELTLKLLELAGYNDLVSKSNKEKVIEYKAKVKALEILNNHLDEYHNDLETLNITVVYQNGKPTPNTLFSLLLNMEGLTYNNVYFSSLDNNSSEERVISYLNDYKLDKNDPLKLKN